MMCNRRHGRETNVTLTDTGMTIHAGATGSRGIVEVEELGHAAWSLFDVVQWLVAAGKDVAGIDADAEPWIIDVRDEAGKGLLCKEHLAALARGCLQEDGTGRSGILHGL